MLAIAHAACLIGIEAHPVQVEVRLGEGLPGFDIVGLPERGVRESRIRVRAALPSIGFAFPPRHLVLNLAPGDVPKAGAELDLAIAAAILAACGGVSSEQLPSTLPIGELSLSGELRPVRGVLALLRSARQSGLQNAIIPEGSGPVQAGSCAVPSGARGSSRELLTPFAEQVDVAVVAQDDRFVAV